MFFFDLVAWWPFNPALRQAWMLFPSHHSGGGTKRPRSAGFEWHLPSLAWIHCRFIPSAKWTWHLQKDQFISYLSFHIYTSKCTRHKTCLGGANEHTYGDFLWSFLQLSVFRIAWSFPKSGTCSCELRNSFPRWTMQEQSWKFVFQNGGGLGAWDSLQFSQT